MFPHHENELAQSRCTHGTSVFARYWMHNGYLTIHGDKMSKSLGNIVSARKALDDLGADVLRLWVSATDYRGEVTVSD